MYAAVAYKRTLDVDSAIATTTDVMQRTQDVIRFQKQSADCQDEAKTFICGEEAVHLVHDPIEPIPRHRSV